jgi:D-aminoacyl-tRNA deacylase
MPGFAPCAATLLLMRVVLQRVKQALVTVEGAVTGAIDYGVLLLVGITTTDTPEKIQVMAKKIAVMRIFPALSGPSGVDRSLIDVGGAALVVSQFTLYGDVSGGRRPSFIAAARPEQAAPLVDLFAETLAIAGVPVARGVFGAEMQVSLVNDGPFTLVIES